MRDAVIVSTARTPIGRAFRGAFNATPAPTLAAHALRAAVERAERRAGRNRRLHPRLRTASRLSAHDRPNGGVACGPACRSPGHDDGPPMLFGPDEHSDGAPSRLSSIAWTSCWRAEWNRSRTCRRRNCGLHADPELVAMHDDTYMAMIDTAEVVAKRYRHLARAAGCLRTSVPAAHRGGASCRPLRRRDRAGDREQGVSE